MIWHAAIETELAEPPIRQIEVDFLAQVSLGADAKAIADNQHPHHELRINRWPPERAVEWRQLPPQLTELHEPVDRAQQMVVGMCVRARTHRTKQLFNCDAI